MKPDVTIVAIDTIYHALTRKAVEESMAVAKRAIVFSDSADAVPLGAEWIRITIPTGLTVYQVWDHFIWHVAPYFIETSHCLTIHWDGFVLDADLFDPDWLKFDWVGAKWWYYDDCNVGNGGFSLRSAKLMRYVKDNVPFHAPEDVAICRVHGKALKKAGFKFAPDQIADEFSFECVAPRLPTFGFHCLRNFPLVLNKARLAEREALFTDRIRQSNDYRLMRMAA